LLIGNVELLPTEPVEPVEHLDEVLGLEAQVLLGLAFAG